MRSAQFRDYLMSISPPGMLELPTDATRLPNGNVLITDAGDWNGFGSELLEVDRLGNIVWHYAGDILYAHSARLTSWGGILISDTNNNRILEVDRFGRTLWTSEDFAGGKGTLDDGSHFSYPNFATETPDGTILVSDRDNDRAVEFTREGRIVWACTLVKGPHNAERLANGHTMIADSNNNRVVEVSRKGEIVWQYGDGTPEILAWPRDADRLPGGNTLIADTRNRRVIEVSPDGKLVWQFQLDIQFNPYDAERLPNGHTLISDQARHRVFEVDPAGNIIWQFRNYYRPEPLNKELVNGGFEEEAAPGAGRPLGWIPCSLFDHGGGQTFLWDAEVRRSGRRSVGVKNEGAGGLWWIQFVQVKPGRPYRLAGYVKTEGLERGAGLTIVFQDRDAARLQPRVQPEERQASYSGTNDWTLVEREITAPPEATAAIIQLTVMGKGSAWFDDIEFYEIPWL